MKRILIAVAVLLVLAIPLAVDSQEAPRKGAEMPVGSIVAWHAFGKATTTPPEGWQRCDGSAITDAVFVARFGKGHRTPNLNGGEGKGLPNSGRPCFLRGGPTSPVGGYAGDDQHRHDIPHRHSVAHTHDLAHTHAVPHRHSVSLRTSTDGGAGKAGKDGFGGTRRHSHDVRGQTGDANSATTRAPTPARSGTASVGSSGPPQTTASARSTALPRYFTVTWIIKVR